MARTDSLAFEFAPEAENFEYQEAEWTGEEEEVFSEAELLELAGGLLQVTNEAELDQFLGKVIRRASRAVGSAVSSPAGRAIGGVLKGVAKRALPVAGGMIGGYFGGPLGARIGSGLASMAGSAFGLEAEALEGEDREFEGAKQLVRMAGQTVKSTLAANPASDLVAAAQRAAAAAAGRFLPGLAGGATGTGVAIAGRSTGGRWVRKGRHIVLLNI